MGSVIKGKKVQCGFVQSSSLLGVQSVGDVVKHGRLRWFGHMERESGWLGVGL